MDFSPGTIIDDTIRLTRELDRGGMGTIWLAEQMERNEQVAVKFLHEAVDVGSEQAKRFEREATLAARISNPHVVRIEAHGRTVDGQPYIVMEHLQGESLRALVDRDGHLSLDDTRTVIAQLCEALAAAHDLRIIHRDIKPANVFLVNNEGGVFAKLLDFGVSKSDNDQAINTLSTSSSAVLGTPSFMSPEQLTDSKGVDHRCDLWAVGVIAYLLLTGRYPFTGETITSLCIAICTKSYPSLKELGLGLSASMDAWFAKALAKEASKRFRDARAMAHAFEQALEAATAKKGAGIVYAPTVRGDEVRGKHSRLDASEAADIAAAVHTVKNPGAAHGLSPSERTTVTNQRGAMLSESVPSGARAQKQRVKVASESAPTIHTRKNHRSLSGWLLAAAATLVLAALVGTWLASIQRSQGPAEAAGAASARRGTASAASTAPGAQSAVVANSAPAPSQPVAAATDLAPAPTLSASAQASAAPPPKASRRLGRSPRRKKRVDCKNPFVRNADGDLRLRKECH